MNAHSILKWIIFDFDGVLADTEPLHFRAFQSVLSEEGIHLSGKETMLEAMWDWPMQIASGRYRTDRST